MDPHIAEVYPFNLARLMRQHKVTLRMLTKRTGLTLKRIRVIRSKTHVTYGTLCDLTQAVTGVNIFNRSHYDSLI